MTDKLTDNEIVKAKAHFEYGIKCDIFQEPVLSYAKTVLEAFEEINRQKKDYEALKKQEEKAHQYCKNVCEPKYKAEIETLQKHLAEQLAVNERLIEEIHQGTITTEIQMRAEKQYQWQQLEKIKRAKAEAYKEFAYALKSIPRKAVYKNEIDRILKERLSGCNAE